MGDVVADAGNLMDESFDLAQHPIDADGELIEWVIALAGRQALAQIAVYDTLDSIVDLQESTAGTQAQHHSDGDRQNNGRQQAQRKGAHDDSRKVGEFVDIAADRNN